MIVRLGYVAIALNLKNVKSSSTVTFSYYNKLKTDDEKLNKLISVTKANLDGLYKILKYNVENQIHFYRISSAIIPLATHPEVENWNYREIFKDSFKTIGEFIQDNNLRVDTHPDQFNVINSVNSKTVENTTRNLVVHSNFFEDINYNNGKMVLHVGGKQDGIDLASKRFIDNFKKLPKEITSKIILENDDKSFSAMDTLNICKNLNIPMVLDLHHHKCHNNNESLLKILEDFISTWNNEYFPPKIHYSTPRAHKLDRKHADYINAIEFVNFLELFKTLDTNLDVMIEAKNKDLALFKLHNDIKRLKPEWTWLDNSTILI